MDLVENKTSELIGPALDWAVAVAIGWKEPIFGVGLIRYFEEDRYLMMETPDPNESDDVTKPHHFNHYEQWSPRRIWSQGGPLIEQYQIDTVFDPNGKAVVMGRLWVNQRMHTAFGPTPLIAAMRCLVATKLGDTVQVPSELI